MGGCIVIDPIDGDGGMIDQRQRVVVIGNGMVGLRFCEQLVEHDANRRFQITTFCEEPRAAYDRVGLTSFFAHRDAEKLMLARLEWYRENGVDLHLNDRAVTIDRKAKLVKSDLGIQIRYDYVVLATGSYPFVPPIPGVDKRGVFVYRTIEDLQHIIDYAGKSKSAAVIGGGLLGLEAAKAAYDLGLETHVIEFASRLMPRQIDDEGSQILVNKIEDLGVHVHLNKASKEIHGDRRVQSIEFTDGEMLDVDMIIISAGIRPRDELARAAGLEVGQRGGVVVDDDLQTSDPQIFAVGEVALHDGFVYGLVAPGYEMAEIVARNLCGDSRRFRRADLSTKLKLMGVDVASFGEYEAGPNVAIPIKFEDPIGGHYKKLLFSRDGSRLIGGILIGDASDYGTLSILAKSEQPVPCSPHQLVIGSSQASIGVGIDAMPDDAQICSCNNVRKKDLCDAIENRDLTTIGQLKSCTKAGTGCGGCLPLVSDLLAAELKKSGKSISNALCEHFAYSRTELFAIIKTKRLRTFAQVLQQYGSGQGCEVCKPTLGSIFASLWNENIQETEHATLQDTNDRFLANIQRGGLYSVVPRVPGGEITPEKLSAIAETAKEFGLYTKITGGQRVDLFGARVQDLPDIWERLIEAGMESGHAYGKSLRTVKSCVGSTWCRYGVQDSVGFAIRVENRYKGIRSPHKVKMAVSGCVRECAEAQCKDVGLIATEQGYNLYVCGNGGAKPRHADLLVADVDEETAIKYIDRFFMYYISTADKLMRTSVWCEKLEGGIDHIRQVVVEDKLGIGEELERMMQYLVDTYQCEWKRVVEDPQQRKRFRQFANSDDSEAGIEFVSQRDQRRPADWVPEVVSIEQIKMLDRQSIADYQAEQKSNQNWVRVGSVDDFPIDGGATIKYGKSQIAVFNFASRGQWYACQQMCPHKKAFVLSRGIIGDAGGEPKVACPLHKKTFSLESGQCLSGEQYRIDVFPVKVVGTDVLLALPPVDLLDAVHATEIGCKLATTCSDRGAMSDPMPTTALVGGTH
jgi:nitrite reductase (NADH) large subunit